jgi:lipoate-protein ligase A
LWYLIDSGFKDPYYNMAFDEYLMGSVKDEMTVFLRFFNFKPVSVSIGYHQRVEKYLEDLGEKGIKWVRRRTGGRAVIHSNDFTYSLVFRRDNPDIGGSVVESYNKIAKAFKKAFEILNIPTEIQRGKNRSSKRLKSHLCFSSTSIAELTWNGKKIIGSAQFRDKRIVLQEGTIMLDNHGSIFPDIPEMATLREASGREVKLIEVKDAVLRGFEETYSIHFEEYKFKPLEEELLRKYSSVEWNLGSK